MSSLPVSNENTIVLFEGYEWSVKSIFENLGENLVTLRRSMSVWPYSNNSGFVERTVKREKVIYSPEL